MSLSQAYQQREGGSCGTGMNAHLPSQPALRLLQAGARKPLPGNFPALVLRGVYSFSQTHAFPQKLRQKSKCQTTALE